MQKKTIEEVSAGGVVYRCKGGITDNGQWTMDKVQFLISKHSGYHKWVLPKGLVEQGETRGEAAVREVEEETGVVARIVEQEPLTALAYTYQAVLDRSGETTRRVKRYQEEGGVGETVHKTVYFYLMEAVSEGSMGWEMEDKRWVSFDEGMARLAFESERGVLELAKVRLASSWCP